LFINGEFVAPKSGKYFDSINPANEQKLAEIALASVADVDAAYQAARRAYDSVWSKMPGRERAKYLFRIARLLQDRAREFAVAETMDGGKPIKESRDFDVPMAAAHFFYHAAGRTNWTTSRRGVVSLRSALSGRSSVELSAAHARVEARAGAGHGQLRGPQAAETTSVTCLKLRRYCRMRVSRRVSSIS